MTPDTGLPYARQFRAARRAGLGGVVLTLGFVMAGVPALAHPSSSSDPSADPPHEDETPQKESQRAAAPGPQFLAKQIALIETSFKSGQPEPLTSLLPSEGKTFISLGKGGCAAGYYSRDQVYFILGTLFSKRQTLRFSVRPQKLAENEGPRAREAYGPVYCIGTWAYRGHDGNEGEAEIHFVLLLKKGSWSLVEIREAR